MDILGHNDPEQEISLCDLTQDVKDRLEISETVRENLNREHQEVKERNLLLQQRVETLEDQVRERRKLFSFTRLYH